MENRPSSDEDRGESDSWARGGAVEDEELEDEELEADQNHHQGPRLCPPVPVGVPNSLTHTTPGAYAPCSQRPNEQRSGTVMDGWMDDGY